MSVTFYIENDTDKSVVNKFECMCVDYDTKKAHPDCTDCKGSGEVVFTKSEWELNLANGNAKVIHAALGLPEDGEHGECDGRTLRTAIEQAMPALAHRSEELTGKMWTMGIDEDYVESVHERLLKIAIEAEKREERIVWC